MSEIFGPTFQGEGPTSGALCVFLRLAGCNLSCTWCDTPYTWDWKRFSKSEEVKGLRSLEVAETLTELGIRSNAQRLIISGGEPMLQQAGLLPVMKHLRALDWILEVETAGTIIPNKDTRRLIHHFNVSPKLATSGNTRAARYNEEALEVLSSYDAAFKFVICRKADIKEVNRIVKDIKIPRRNVWLMPEGITVTKILTNNRKVSELALDHGYNFTTRVHTLIHGTKRGV